MGTENTRGIVGGKKLVGGIKRNQASGMEEYPVAGLETPDCRPNRNGVASPSEATFFQHLLLKDPLDLVLYRAIAGDKEMIMTARDLS